MLQQDKIVRLSQSVGQRHSARREAILSVLVHSAGALTADEVHAAASQRIRGLGIATVYRNLKLLLEARVIQEILLPDGLCRYELADQKHHHHFHCEQCGRIFCLKGCIIAEHTFQPPAGFTVRDHEITLHGLCPNCG